MKRSQKEMRARGVIGFTVTLLRSRGTVLTVVVTLLVIARMLGSEGYAARSLVMSSALVTTALGGLFFALVHHALKAKWSTQSVDRIRSTLGLLLWAPLFVIAAWLVCPNDLLWLQLHVSAGWWGRLVLCWSIWLVLGYGYGCSHVFSRASVESAPERRQRYWSGPALVAFAITIGILSLDWMMRIQCGWRSTMFPVYIFAGAVPAGIALLVLSTLLGETRPYEHILRSTQRHHVGTWLFGFSLFWAYVAFSQYLLMWYSNLPGEIGFYDVRSNGYWWPLTLTLVLCRFLLPFVLLLAEEGKRSRGLLLVAAGAVLVGHYIDMTWLIIPAVYPSGVHLGLADALFASASVLCMVRATSRAGANVLKKESLIERLPNAHAAE